MSTEISPTEAARFLEELRKYRLADLAELLAESNFRMVTALQIGCMAVVLEHCCEINSPAEQYAVLNALPQQRKNELLEVAAQFFQPRLPLLNIADIEFFKFS